MAEQCSLCASELGRKKDDKCSISAKLKRSGATARDVLTDLGLCFTPETNPFICSTCRVKIGRIQTSRTKCNESVSEIKKTAKTETYIGGKLLLHNPPTPTARTSKRRMVSTPVKKMSFKQSTPKTSSYIQKASKLVAHSQHYTAVRLLMRSSRAYRGALGRAAAAAVNKEMKCFTSPKRNSVLRTSSDTYASFTNFTWKGVMKEAQTTCPLLLAVLKAAVSPCKKTDRCDTYVGAALCLLAFASKPAKMKVFQELLGIQLWLAGCSREAFGRFNHLGLSVGIHGVRACIDRVREGFDRDLKRQKDALTQSVPLARRQLFSGALEENIDEAVEMLDITHLSDQSNNEDAVIETSSDKEEEGVFSLDFSMDLDTPVANNDPLNFDGTSPSLNSAPAALSESAPLSYEPFDENASSDDNSSLDETMQYTEEIHEAPAMSYSIVFDNVNQKTHARYNTREKGNKMFNMVQAYAAIDRIPSNNEPDYMPNADRLRDIKLECYLPSDLDGIFLWSEYETMVQRIVSKHVPTFQSLEERVVDHMPHQYQQQSKQKSKLIPLGVLMKDESKIVDMVDILDEYSKYVPEKRDGSPAGILLYGDGLSCERVGDAQLARITAANPWDRLQAFTPAIQEWHKRGILLEDTYKLLYSCKSARAAGTLYNIRNVYRHKNVQSRVMHCFNHATDLLRFATESYVIAAACKLSEAEDPDKILEDFSGDENEKWERFFNLCQEITQIAFHPMKILPSDDEPQETYCVCNGEDDGDMVLCENPHCPNGRWFHLECVNLQQEDVPDGDWFCSEECQLEKQYDADQETNIDHRYEYTKALMWRGLGEMVRNDAVRENDGDRMIRHWRYDLLEFYEQHHPKYFICAHRLLTDVNGGTSERIKHQLKWNRTVNVRGGLGHNIEMDLQMEFFNREYKEAVKSAGGNLTTDTIARHSQMVGLSKDIAKLFDKEVAKVKEVKTSRKAVSRSRDIMSLTKRLLELKVFDCIPGRFHHGFESFVMQRQFMHRDGLIKRINKHTEKLAKRLEMMVN